MTLVDNMPREDRVARILRDILGRDVLATKAPFMMVNCQSKGTLGVFTDAYDHVVALVYMDLALSCAAGAALSMIPPQKARQGEASGTVPENILENLVEVYHLLREWFEALEGLRLARVDVLPMDLPHDLPTLLMKPARRLDFHIAISGYASGRYSLCVKP